jgi:hypothetical protein
MQRTPLHLAAQNKDPSVLRMLLWSCKKEKIQIHLDMVDDMNNTALHLAAAAGATQNVERLVKEGSINVKNRKGMTPHYL